MATATATGAVATSLPPGGATLARWVGDRPHDAVVATVLGPGGTGKSMLLDVLADLYTDSGVPVVRYDGASPLAPSTAVLVDDAHRLPPDRLDALRAFARTDGARIVLAHRPWPRPDGLAELSAGVGARRMVAIVGHLDRAAVADRLATRLGGEAPGPMVDLVHRQSGGLPALVDLVTQGLVDGGRVDLARPERFAAPERITVSTALAERLRHRVDALPAPVQDLLTVLAHGAPLDGDVLAQLLAPGAELEAAVEAARATGLLTESGELIPLIGALFVKLTPVLRTRDLHRRLATIELDRGGSVLAAGRRLLGTGASGTHIAAVLCSAAEEALAESPALAAELLAAAVDAGHPRLAVAGRRAHALALAGEIGPALQVADEALDGPDRADAVVAAATALAHRGLPGRSAELLGTLEPGRAVLAVPTLVVTGDLDGARAALAAAHATSGSGTLLEGAARMLGQGMVGTATGSAAALSRLAQAASMLEPVAASTLLPDTPAALTAVVAGLSGQPGVAESTLRRAIEGRHGGRVAVLRHRLLLAWVLMSRGTIGPPTGLVERISRQDSPPEPRDALLAATLEVALARRRDDAGALAGAWARARDALVRQPADLTLIPLLGELSVAATRLGEGCWLDGAVEDVEDVLRSLGHPGLWAAPLAWGRLQAAVAAEDPADVARHATALDATADASPYAAVLAAAGRCWTTVLTGTPDVDDVVATGRRMAGVGLGWEAAQLTGRAAGSTGDRRAAQGLHAVARSLDPAAAAAPPEEGAPVEKADTGTLTEREKEIGRLILAGRTHKQIGERLYISAKTVEHYVARMRQRLGVATRGELFALLQSTLDPTP
ncbi:helix-turn-helix transcriptional regulator [Pseudonocardia abyssalis]|uniref:LuxR family transcriptional regulator n=1 Tax=Pseudonocardia abyssalis TaxID=2792008 RepID=A0ABS6V082_9PSEU|nr:LuxR C-terminal-related transcriptional regulator [Pseudonocardia abyssalis]MBW0116696.1 LuxR family transcriptional regulator [Pseudonocardia abyssalis]MBW0137913.1 LuxR family transcriptional regulator [Pseudonocardia abyssalis]